MDIELKKALSALNVDQQIETFYELASIHGPSTDEKIFADYLSDLLVKMGFSIEFDDVNKFWNGSCGNMRAYWEGTDSSIPPVLLSAHLDTVFSTVDMKPRIVDGIIRGDGNTIIGTDDRSAIAAYVDAVRAIQTTGMPCGPIEMLFTVNEHTGLHGSNHMDPKFVVSKGGFNLDHTGDVGQIITAGPYACYIYIKIKAPEGRNGHIFINPDGLNPLFPIAKIIPQIQQGHIKPNLYMNIGQVNAGYMPPVTPEEASLVCGIWTVDKNDLDDILANIKKVSEDAAAEYGCTCEFTYDIRYPGYVVNKEEIYYKVAVEAAESLGIKWYDYETCGGGDTNYLRDFGIKQLTLGQGFQSAHNTDDHISVNNLVEAGRYMVALLYYWRKKHL